MDRLFDVITFDCYGTLIDWERGIGQALTAMSRAAGAELDLPSALRAYQEIEPAVQAERFRSYREVLAETARRLAGRLGWRLDPAQAGVLADSLPAWPAFPDTNPALERLARAGHRLGILSNVDDDLLAATRRHLTASFDLIVTAQQVRAYKPAHPHFLTARRHIGGQRWLHAAQSYFHDVVPARACGIPVAWINRKGEPATDGRAPTRELRTLADLAEWLAPHA
jgi:2-haloalkanoic acid dehalogenase type II